MSFSTMEHHGRYEEIRDARHEAARLVKLIPTVTDPDELHRLNGELAQARDAQQDTAA